MDAPCATPTTTTPTGYQPAIYSYASIASVQVNPWGQGAAVTPMAQFVQVCMKNALNVFLGNATWATYGIDMVVFWNTAVTSWGVNVTFITDGL